MKKSLSILLSLCCFTAMGQGNGQFIKDAKTGCQIWDPYYSPQDSASWKGACKNTFAEGPGTLTWYVEGKEVARYEGVLQKGNPNGKGKYTIVGQGGMEGNFVNGEPIGKGKTTFANGKVLEGNFSALGFIILDEPYLKQLHKTTTNFTDSTDIYVSDGDAKELFYFTLVPQHVKGVLVLLSSSGETVESVINCNKKLMQLAFQNNILTVIPSINNDQGLDSDPLALDFLNAVFNEVAQKYNAPKDKYILGGFSGGGMIALRYTEMSRADVGKTAIVPVAVYGVDPPLDLAKLYERSKHDVEMNEGKQGLSPGKLNGLRESKWIMEDYNKRFGGSPEQFPQAYVRASMYARSEKDGGNARSLTNVPVRLYCDPDILWAMKERYHDYYDMNAPDESAMINFLNLNGNQHADFIPALGKGYRLDGTRHPHSWSIVDPVNCMSWLLQWIR